MGRKTKKREKAGRERAGETLTLLGLTFETDTRTVKGHILTLVLLSLATKLVVLFATPAVFHSFIDLFDLQFYLQSALPITQGKIPYLDFGFDYPILIFVPIGIALVPALALQSGMAFVSTFQLLMVLCDLGTLLCVYLIGLRVWNERAAWHAGLAYATAFSVAYFVLTKYDAFPTLLLMGAVLFTVSSMKLRGYLSATLGFFAKIFPAVAFPFMILYHAKATSLREEIVSAMKVFLPFALVLLLPFLLLSPSSLGSYLFATGSGLGVYANSATYTLYLFLHDILGLGISAEAVSTVMYALMGIALLFLLYLAFTERREDPKAFLKVLLCAVFSLVLFTKFHSPQYIVWFTPFLCLLLADDPLKISLFYLTQAFGYMEFPLLFGGFYVNLQYVNPPGSAGWYMTLAFFTLDYLALIALVLLVVRPEGGLRRRLSALIPRS